MQVPDPHLTGIPDFPGYLLRDILQWDVNTWVAALRIWHPVATAMPHARVLDIGARDGGLSLYFALLGHNVLCSDLRGPSLEARALHARYDVGGRIRYAAIDATQIAATDGQFDLVCFKSVLGGVGYGNRFDRQKEAVTEMYRVLRPGGALLFAENLHGSLLHQMLRRWFVRWGRGWRYPSPTELPELFFPFEHLRTECRGVLACFGRTERQRALFHGLDVVLDPLLFDRCKYMVAGVAKKAQPGSDACSMK